MNITMKGTCRPGGIWNFSVPGTNPVVHGELLRTGPYHWRYRTDGKEWIGPFRTRKEAVNRASAP